MRNSAHGIANGQAAAAAAERLNGFKSNVGSLSGLSTISGRNSNTNSNGTNGNSTKHHNHQSLSPLMGPYCQKQQQQQQQQQQQHANYNTGFYHHYQQAPEMPFGISALAATANTNAGLRHSPLTSPYQISMAGNNRVTKLFLANPTSSGTYSVDNNYIPIVPHDNSAPTMASNGGWQAPRSDDGSVYQTIY